MNGEPKKKLHEHIIHHTRRAVHHVRRHTKRFLIPHAENEYKPHALRPKALRFYSTTLILVKIFVTGFLFILYPSEAEFATYSANQVFSLTNSSRADSKVPLLRRSAVLDTAAAAKTKHMFEKGYFAHTAPDGTKPWAFLDQAGYAYVAAGENLAIDFTDAEAMHAAFLASPSHRANILNPRYEEMGLAVAEGLMEGSKTILVVEFFGTPYTVKTAKTETKPAPTTSKPRLTDFRAADAKIEPKTISAQTGERVNVSVSFRNAGRATWDQSGAYTLLLQVGTGPKVKDDSWLSDRDVTRLKQTRVRPGERGEFAFVVKTPETSGAIEKSFGVTVTSLGRITGGTITLPIEVKERPRLVETHTEIAGVQTTEIPPGPPPEVQPTTEATPLPPSTPTKSEMPTEEFLVYSEAEKVGQASEGFPKQLMDYSRGFFLAILVFLIVAMLMNILIEIRIQHPHVILQTVLVIALTGLAFAVRFHFLEAVGQSMRII